MSLSEQIDLDFKQALKSQDFSTIGVLRMLKSAIKNKAIEKKADLDDADIVLILKSEAKKRKESIEAFKKGERDDLVKKEQVELKVLEAYLPEQLSAEEINKKIHAVIADLPEAEQQNFGRVMGAVMKELAGLADGQLVGELVKKALAPED
jgi:uncharacterized protein YqeY